MRILFAAPLLLLGACQVTEDKANSETTIEYNQDVAENAAADIGNTAENVGGAIANTVENTADKVQNRAEKVDVTVDTNTDTPAKN